MSGQGLPPRRPRLTEPRAIGDVPTASELGCLLSVALGLDPSDLDVHDASNACMPESLTAADPVRKAALYMAAREAAQEAAQEAAREAAERKAKEDKFSQLLARAQEGAHARGVAERKAAQEAKAQEAAERKAQEAAERKAQEAAKAREREAARKRAREEPEPQRNDTARCRR